MEYKFKLIPQAERFYSEDSSYGVYVFSTDADIPHLKQNPSNPFDDFEPMKFGTLTGKMQRLTLGMEYEVTANEEFSKKYNSYSYVPSIVMVNHPKTEAEQARYLKTQVTALQAENILAVYPNIVDDVLNNRDIDITKIKGVGEITWKHIKENIVDNYVISDILVMLQPLGVSYNMICKLLSEETNPILLKEKLLTDPYILTKIHGIGFVKADKIALKLIPELRCSEKRVIAFIKHYLKSVGEDDGHTFIPITQLNAAAMENIPECKEPYNKFLSDQKENQLYLVFYKDKVGLRSMYNKEFAVYNALKELDEAKSNFTINIEAGIAEAEEEQGFCFTEEQREYIKKACSTNVVLISGLAGTGKTTILRALCKIYKTYDISACALSAKAAQRIIEATSRPASTIHRLLGYKGGKFLYGKDNPLPSSVIILDEASMVNVPIFLSLVEAVRKGAKLIICGDNGQLPPIGYGNMFNDLLELDIFNSCKLTKILRQAEKSGIITDSKKIRNNENPLNRPELKTVTGELQDMTYMFRDNREGMRDMAIRFYLQTVENDSVDDTIIIVPCKQDRVNSTEEINNIIQDNLIPVTEQGITFGSKRFRIGAKLIQRANNYEKNVFNGEIGYLESIWKDGAKNMLTVLFGKDKRVDFEQKEMQSLELAYALTVHVTQGSGYKNVIAVIDNTHYKLLDSCLLYTALTRAKKKCLLIAEPQAFRRCIDRKASKRNTWLSLLQKGEKVDCVVIQRKE